MPLRWPAILACTCAPAVVGDIEMNMATNRKNILLVLLVSWMVL
jgi:hypothetical protein